MEFRRVVCIVVLTALGLLGADPGYGQRTADARQIFEEYEKRQTSVRSEVATIRMEIFGREGAPRTRTLTAYTKVGADERVRSMVVFTDPADIRGMGLLTIETEAGDDQRLYLPALGRVQQISGSRRSERFAGSDFTYEDLGSQDPDQFDLALLEETTKDWIIEAVPRDRSSQYARIEFTIERERYILTAARYFDQQNREWKALKAGPFSNQGHNRWRADRMEMRDLRDDRRTVLTFVRRETGADLSDDFFSERQLQRAGG